MHGRVRLKQGVLLSVRFRDDSLLKQERPCGTVRGVHLESAILPDTPSLPCVPTCRRQGTSSMVRRSTV